MPIIINDSSPYVKYPSIVNGVAPVFTGPIVGPTQSGNFTFDISGYAVGQTLPYSVSPALPAGITFNTSTGVFTIVAATFGTGTSVPFTVSYNNGFGSTPSNPFTITVLPSVTGVKKDYVGHWVRLTGNQSVTDTEGFLPSAQTGNRNIKMDLWKETHISH